jgi:hypothetical protein
MVIPIPIAIRIVADCTAIPIGVEEHRLAGGCPRTPRRVCVRPRIGGFRIGDIGGKQQ